MRVLTVPLIVSTTLVLSSTTLLGQAGYSLRKTIPIGGQGGWDYLAVDTARNRLFVSHGNQVEVVDLARDSVVGTIANTPGVHGIAIAYELGRGYVSSGRDSAVTIFDLKTLAVIRRVNVQARNPDAIAYDPYSKRVFTFNGGSASATALDAAIGDVVGTIPLSGKPEFWATDATGRMWVNIEDKGTLVRFDPTTLRVTAEWPLPGCGAPTGLGFDVKRTRLFPVCNETAKMLVVDGNDGTVLATLPIGQRVDGGGFDPGPGLAFASAGEGKLTVVGEDKGTYRVVQEVATQPGARTMVVDPRTHRIYLSTADYGPPPAPGQRAPVVPGSFKVLVIGPATP